MEQRQARLASVRRRMEEAGLGQLLITDHLSIYYLTGIHVVPMERFWALLVTAGGGEVLFANQLFSLGETGLPTVTMTDGDDPAALVAPYVAPGVLGVDKGMAARFLLPIMAACGETRVVLGSACVDSVRACKDQAEQALMRRASWSGWCAGRTASHMSIPWRTAPLCPSSAGRTASGISGYLWWTVSSRSWIAIRHPIMTLRPWSAISAPIWALREIESTA